MIGRTSARERAAASRRGSAPLSDAGPSKARGGLGPRRMRGEEGLAAFVVCIPAFFLAVLLAIQFALWAHASHLARAAAEQGASTAAEHDAQAVTQKMLLPGVLLMAGYGVLIFYPALASFTGSHL